MRAALEVEDELARPGRRGRFRRSCAGRRLTVSMRPSRSISIWPLRSATMSGSLCAEPRTGRPALQRLFEQRGHRPRRCRSPSSGGQAWAANCDPRAGAADVGVVEELRRGQGDRDACEMSASPGPAREDRVQRRVAGPLDRPPESCSESFGREAAASAQLATWKGSLEVGARRLGRRRPVASTENGSQLVGLRAKFGRSRLTRIARSRSGMPSRICGSGSETAVIWASVGSTWSATRTTTLPRS